MITAYGVHISALGPFFQALPRYNSSGRIGVSPCHLKSPKTLLLTLRRQRTAYKH